MILSGNSHYKPDKMDYFLKSGKVCFFLLLLCLQMETVYAKSTMLKQSTVPSKEVHSAIAPHSTSKVTDDTDDSDISSATYDSAVQDIATPIRLTSKQKLRHEEMKVRKSKEGRHFSKRTNDKKSRKKGRRHRSRSRADLGFERKSCPTRTSYVSKSTAIDIFGDTVDVYPVIHIENLALDQYFYESFCDIERCSCGGIDNKKFKSSCQTTHSYTYAKVIKSGEIGWSYIKVRSGCSCVIQEKGKTGPTSILDLLS